MLRQLCPRRLTVVASVTGVLLVAPLVGLASAASTNVTLLSTAGLHARGAGIAVQVSVACSSGASGFVDVVLSQRVSPTRVQSGSSSAAVVCDGAAHRVRIGIVPRDPNTGALGSPFHVGPAFVTTNVNVCTDVCVNDRDAGTVDVQSIILNKERSSSANVTVKLPASGRVEARGAGAIVRLPYRCSRGTSGTFFATLVQRTPTDTLISATAQVTPTCDGQDHAGLLAFHAPGEPWHRGPVFVTLTGTLCATAGCSDARALRTLTLE